MMKISHSTQQNAKKKAKDGVQPFSMEITAFNVCDHTSILSLLLSIDKRKEKIGTLYVCLQKQKVLNYIICNSQNNFTEVRRLRKLLKLHANIY